MKEEIAAAVFFVARLVKRYGVLENDSRERFAASLTSVLFENYKNHWNPSAPTRGQAYRCLRMNRVQLQDPVLLEACERSNVRYEDLGLPQELTLWVDPGEVSCRYGERSAPFCVSAVDRRDGGEFSRRIHDAVERASFDVQSGSSSDEEEVGGDNSMNSSSSIQSAPCSAPNPPTTEPKTIPTVSNPNSVYRFSEFSPGAPQTWLRDKRKLFSGEALVPHPAAPGAPSSQKVFKSYRATFSFSGPRVDKYHWVSKSRS
ncbi:protein BTG4 isoform X1 [Amphiprion ocellaris]|uniref:Anti-proliferative protein domain-containing protein n=1 Tax=Amphiprion ocellaris TaxID=80972 RepID=A0A3Q1BP13_AMPOC|nr:protein BTG4 isoform X1 [Amphiprion ocellaris]